MKIQSRDDLLTHHSLTRLGAELGVAGGKYSEHLLKNAPIRRLYSINAWSSNRGHDILQCDAASRRLSKYGDRSIVLRARCDEAFALFDDAGLDFVRTVSQKDFRQSAESKSVVARRFEGVEPAPRRRRNAAMGGFGRS